MELLLKDNDGFPTVCDTVFTTVVPNEKGQAAILYWARCMHYGTPLTLLDFDVTQLLPSLWDDIRTRVESLRKQCRARYPSPATMVEGVVLAQQAEQRGVGAEVIPEPLTAPGAWQSLSQAASFHVRGGEVKYTSLVASKSETKAFGALRYDGGERGDDPTVPAFLYGVVMSLEDTTAWVAPPIAERQPTG